METPFKAGSRMLMLSLEVVLGINDNSSSLQTKSTLSDLKIAPGMFKYADSQRGRQRGVLFKLRVLLQSYAISGLLNPVLQLEKQINQVKSVFFRFV